MPYQLPGRYFVHEQGRGRDSAFLIDSADLTTASGNLPGMELVNIDHVSHADAVMDNPTNYLWSTIQSTAVLKPLVVWSGGGTTNPFTMTNVGGAQPFYWTVSGTLPPDFSPPSTTMLTLTRSLYLKDLGEQQSEFIPNSFLLTAASGTVASGIANFIAFQPNSVPGLYDFSIAEHRDLWRQTPLRIVVSGTTSETNPTISGAMQVGGWTLSISGNAWTIYRRGRRADSSNSNNVSMDYEDGTVFLQNNGGISVLDGSGVETSIDLLANDGSLDMTIYGADVEINLTASGVDSGINLVASGSSSDIAMRAIGDNSTIASIATGSSTIVGQYALGNDSRVVDHAIGNLSYIEHRAVGSGTGIILGCDGKDSYVSLSAVGTNSAITATAGSANTYILHSANGTNSRITQRGIGTGSLIESVAGGTNSRISIVASGTGSQANIDALGGDVNIRAQGGDVSILGVGGDVTLRAIGGDVNLLAEGGDINVDADAGAVNFSANISNINMTTGLGKIVLDAANQEVNLVASDGDIVFDSAAGNDVLVVKSTGRVGLGTASPTERLHVVGSGIVTGNLRVTQGITSSGISVVVANSSPFLNSPTVSGLTISDAPSVNDANGDGVIVRFNDNSPSMGGKIDYYVGGAPSGRFGFNGDGGFEVTQFSNIVKPFSIDPLAASNAIVIGNATRVGINVSAATTISGAAQLQVDSTNRGFLPPRMTNAQKVSIAAPPDGLMIYNTTSGTIDVRSSGVWRSMRF